MHTDIISVWYSERYFGPNLTKMRFQIKPHIFFLFCYYGIQWNFNSKSAVFTIFGGIRNWKLKVDFIETKGIQLRRRPSASSSVETLGFNETTFSFNFWTPKKSWNRRLTVKVSLNTVIKKLKKYVRFYLKSRFSHVWPKIPFWIPKLKRYLYLLSTW